MSVPVDEIPSQRLPDYRFVILQQRLNLEISESNSARRRSPTPIKRSPA
jgi:hypothetical protein